MRIYFWAELDENNNLTCIFPISTGFYVTTTGEISKEEAERRYKSYEEEVEAQKKTKEWLEDCIKKANLWDEHLKSMKVPCIDCSTETITAKPMDFVLTGDKIEDGWPDGKVPNFSNPYDEFYGVKHGL